MPDYHNPGGVAVDVTRHAVTECPDCGEQLSTEPVSWWIAWLPPDPPKVPTPAAGRTRSPRWRAGTRRARKLARRRPCPPPADPLAGWKELGWTEDPADAQAM